MNGELRIFPESGYVVIALANADFGASEAVSWVSERLPKQERQRELPLRLDSRR